MGVELIGLEQTIARLAMLSSSIKDMGVHLEKARPEAEGIVKKNFEAGGRPSGWAAKKDGSASHLMKSGNLVGGIRSRVEDRAIVIYTSGVAGAYAAVHQFGSDKQNIPARPYMIIPDDEKDILFQIIAGSIEETFNR